MTAHRVFRQIETSLHVGLGLLASFVAFAGPASALVIAGGTLDMTTSVVYNAGTGRFEYSYSFTDLTNAAALDSLRVTANEAPAHTLGHLHGEVNFVNDGGVFAYDRPPVGGLLAHNYDWKDLDIGALATTTISYQDIHGPTMATMRVEYAPAGTVNLLGVPVPNFGAFIAGPGGGGGGIEGGFGGVCVGTTVLNLNKCYTYLGTAVLAVAGGFQYKKFLKNTGAVAIGPDAELVPNFANHFEAVHPTHLLINHEVFNEPDNGCAVIAGKAGPVYQWLGLGDGGACGVVNPAAWDVGEVLTLGFFDPHGPAPTGWAGQVFGSLGEGGSDDPAASETINPVPEPAALALFGFGLAGLGLMRRRRAV